MIALMNGVRSGRQVLRNAGQIRSAWVGMPRNFIPWRVSIIFLFYCAILCNAINYYIIYCSEFIIACNFNDFNNFHKRKKAFVLDDLLVI